MLRNSRAFSSFSVDDLRQAENFYGATLGLAVSEGPMGLELLLNGGRIFIYPKPDHEPASFTVLNFSVDNLEETLAALETVGVHPEAYDRPGLKTDERGILAGEGMKIAWFKDPAGNILSVIEED